MQVKKQQLELDMKQLTCSKLGKEYVKVVYSHPDHLIYAEYIMRNDKLDESQAGIKLSGRNTNNLRYTDNTTLMAESEEELKGLLMRMKEESEKAGLKLNIQKLRSWHRVHGIHHFMANSVQFSSVVSDTLPPHGLQYARPPCPSPTPLACSDSCPLSRWCHPNISSCHPLLLLPSIFPSIRVFSNESVLPIRWPKYWSFGFSISPSNEYSGLISSRMDWLDLLAVQGTLKHLLQHHSSKASILQHSVFFRVQLSHP